MNNKPDLKIAEQAMMSGDYADALNLLDKLDVDCRTDSRFWILRARINTQLGNRRAAIEDWSQAIMLCDKEPHYFYMRGIELFSTGEYKNATIDFTKVIELCDHYKSDYYREPAHFFRADCFLRLREFEKAKADCFHVSDMTRIWTDRLKSKVDILSECF